MAQKSKDSSENNATDFNLRSTARCPPMRSTCLEQLKRVTRFQCLTLFLCSTGATSLLFYTCVSFPLNLTGRCSTWGFGNLCPVAGESPMATVLIPDGSHPVFIGKARNISDFKMDRRLPSCIIIGARKSGTRALLQFLNGHPDIRILPRESHFFDRNFEEGLDFYRAKMPLSYPWEVTLEKTPSYFTTEGVPEKISAMNSTLRLLLILRNPLHRSVSDWLQLHLKDKRQGVPSEALRSFEQLALDPQTGNVRINYPPIKRSIYHVHLRRWLHHFPLEQMHFVDGENMISNPVRELNKVEDFLELRRYFTREHFYFNRKRGFFCMRRRRQKIKCLRESKGRQHPQLKPKFVAKMMTFFRPHNEKLFALARRRFNWT